MPGPCFDFLTYHLSLLSQTNVNQLVKIGKVMVKIPDRFFGYVFRVFFYRHPDRYPLEFLAFVELFLVACHFDIVSKRLQQINRRNAPTA